MKAEKISTELLDMISNLPFDVLIEKHELHGWDKRWSDPYLFEIDGKKIVLEPYVEPHEVELKTSFISPDEQFMIVMFYHNDHEEHYIAIARWHPLAQIYVTLFFHNTYIADWESFKSIYTLNKE